MPTVGDEIARPATASSSPSGAPRDRRRSRDQRIAPDMPSGAVPAWSARTNKHNLQPADADDRGDNADIERPRLEHGALLDVQFQKRADVVAARPTDAIRVAADPAQRIAQMLAAGSGEIEHRVRSAPDMPRLPTQESP